jgi:hypothetical protein
MERWTRAGQPASRDSSQGSVVAPGRPQWRDTGSDWPYVAGVEAERETLQTPDARGHRVGVAVAAFLLGVGLSQAVVALEGADPGAPPSEGLDAERRVALRREARAEEEQRQELLSDRSRRLAVVEEGLVAFARETVGAVSAPGYSCSLTTADRPVRAALTSWQRALRSGDERAMRKVYSRGASVVFLQAGFVLYRAEGASQVALRVSDLMTRRLELTARIVGEGQFAGVRYADDRSHGIVLVRVLDGRIAEQWVIVDA